VNLTLKIYNSAGELVVVLAQDLSIPASFSGLGSPSEALVPDLGGGSVQLLGTGLSLAWDGRNSGGQMVDGGSYIALAEVKDPYGAVTSYQSGFSVMRLPSQLTLSVYNSAGERVFEQLGAAPSVPHSGDIVFSGDQLLLDGSGQAKLEVSFGSLALPMSWDGRNSQGGQVSPGLYIVKLEASQPGLAPTIVSQQVQVLSVAGPDPLAGAVAAPNPAGPKDAQVTFFLNAAYPGLRVRLLVYGLSGERVAVAGNWSDPRRLVWDLGAAAPGVYLAVLETEGKRVERKLIKVAVRR
jgi:hypothetical protein